MAVCGASSRIDEEAAAHRRTLIDEDASGKPRFLSRRQVRIGREGAKERERCGAKERAVVSVKWGRTSGEPGLPLAPPSAAHLSAWPL